MKRTLLAFALSIIGACAAAAQTPTSLPIGKGLPVLVKVAVAFVEITALNENTSTYKATVDVRLRWEDPRLRRPSEEATDPPKVYRAPRHRRNWRTCGCRRWRWSTNAEQSLTRRLGCAFIQTGRWSSRPGRTASSRPRSRSSAFPSTGRSCSSNWRYAA